jgi:hypothetical protein
MLKLSESAAKLIIDIMNEQGLDPLRDVFVITENKEGFAISFTRDLATTEIISGLRVAYRGTPLEIDVPVNGQKGLIFTGVQHKC